ncbi:MAG: DsrE family protein [Desulforegulaceae bacterium]|nr:DsrE family protein [Desulforegulaceae bacterium]
MKKIAFFVFNGDPMCFVHVLLNCLDMKEKGYDIKLVIEGASAGLIPKISSLDKPIPDLWEKVKSQNIVDAVCKACAYKLGALDAAKEQNLPLTGDMSGHPSMASYIEDGYEIITF